MKRLVKALAVFLTLLALFHLTIFFANNRIAAETEQRLLEAPLPPDTQIVESRAIAGKRLGNGNGMQYYGFLLVKSSLTAVELEAWYRDRVALEDGYEGIWVTRAETPYLFQHQNLRFRSDCGGEDDYQVMLQRNVDVGSEHTVWEGFLNMDWRGH